MNKILFIGFTTLTISFYPQKSAYADSVPLRQSTMSESQNPLQKGKGLLVTGILTTSILCGAGALSTFIWGMGGGIDYLAMGAAMITVGAGAGIPMIVIGGQRHRKWKQWNRANTAQQATFQDLSITAVDRYIGLQEERFKNAKLAPEKKRLALPVLTFEF